MSTSLSINNSIIPRFRERDEFLCLEVQVKDYITYLHFVPFTLLISLWIVEVNVPSADGFSVMWKGAAHDPALQTSSCPVGRLCSNKQFQSGNVSWGQMRPSLTSLLLITDALFLGRRTEKSHGILFSFKPRESVQYEKLVF